MDDGLFSYFPSGCFSQIFGWLIRVPQRYACGVLGEAKFAKGGGYKGYDLCKLFLYLLWGAEDMCVILCKAACTCEAVQLAMLLVAVDCTKLCEPEWKLSVGANFVSVDFAVMGAIHRLEEEELVRVWCGYGLKSIAAIFFVMARCHIQAFVGDVGGSYWEVASFALGLAHVFYKLFTQNSSLWQPKGETKSQFF